MTIRAESTSRSCVSVASSSKARVRPAAICCWKESRSSPTGRDPTALGKPVLDRRAGAPQRVLVADQPVGGVRALDDGVELEGELGGVVDAGLPRLALEGPQPVHEGGSNRVANGTRPIVELRRD